MQKRISKEDNDNNLALKKELEERGCFVKVMPSVTGEAEFLIVTALINKEVNQDKNEEKGDN